MVTLFELGKKKRRKKKKRIYIREMLTNVLRVLVNNQFKESFYEKRKEKKKAVNVLTVFFIFHKNCVKTLKMNC